MSEKEENSQQKQQVLTVGLGASAGGLEAFKAFFNSLPDETGMAFIVVLHLAPGKKSSLAEILQSQTSLNVQQVSGKTPIEADHVYIIPPDKMLTVEDEHLALSEPENKHGLDTINLLFRTLAEKKGKYAAGIIFSGSGSDGTSGLKAIKEHDGFALVQDPDESVNSSMPYSAIRTGVTDKVLPVKDMVEELVKYQQTFSKIIDPEDADDIDEEDVEAMLSKLFDKIREHNGHDFGNYRRSSVLRRINRRMRVNQTGSLQKYVEYVENNPDEIEELFKDLLISVTDFFRNEEAFKALEEQVIPKLFEDKTQSDQVRVWVTGCATGEEAYSVAMLLMEYSEQTEHYPELQVFASDVDEEALKTARDGRYPQSISESVSDERLRRFFKEDDDDYIVKKELKDIILFASHDLLGNAPFSNQDLIVCRNLLIYLNRDLQYEVFKLMYYALRPAGWLFLGRSDSHIGTEGLFKTIDRSHHIYQQKPSSRSHTKLPDLPLLYKSKSYPSKGNSHNQNRKNIEKLHWHLLSRLFAPESVIIDEDYNVIHATAGINEYLEYTGGEPSRNILEMAKPKIRQSLRSLLFKLKKSESPSDEQSLKIGQNGKSMEIIGRNFHDEHFEEDLIHLIFKKLEEQKKRTSKHGKTDGEAADGEESEIIESLENELDYTKEQLQISVEQYETSNEELRTSNEELQSMNEELQSTTEELETSKEELQSVNEELKTVNEELEDKVDELSRANNDLQNMMETTEVAILFVNLDGEVQRFTRSATELFNLIPSDEGRPLNHITHSLKHDHLMDDIEQVKDDLGNVKKIISTNDNRHYIMRLRPYRSTDGEVQGVVLVFNEITELKASEDKLEQRSRQQNALAELGVYALSQNDVNAVFEKAIGLSCIVLDLNCVVKYKLSQKDDTLQVERQAGCAKELEPLPVEEKWDIGHTVRQNKHIEVADYEDEDRFEISPFLAGRNIKSSIHVPVHGTDKVHGLMGFYSTEKRKFTESEKDFIQIVANIISSVIEQDETFCALENEVEKSRQYQKEILNTNFAERWELGSFLHDNLAQSLASVKIKIDTLGIKLADKDVDISSEVDRIDEIIDDGVEGIRNLTHDVIPIDIEEEGVEHAFRFLMHRIEKLYGIRCDLKLGKVIDEVKNVKLATYLYQNVQEAVRNAVNHGEAKNITVTVDSTDNKMVLEVKDDGFGLDEGSDDGKGQGQRLMKHRTELLGGTMELENISEDGETGTQIKFTVPLEKIRGGGGNYR